MEKRLTSSSIAAAETPRFAAASSALALSDGVYRRATPLPRARPLLDVFAPSERVGCAAGLSDWTLADTDDEAGRASTATEVAAANSAVTDDVPSTLDAAAPGFRHNPLFFHVLIVVGGIPCFSAAARCPITAASRRISSRSSRV